MMPAEQFLYEFHGEDPDPAAVELIDLTLILYAEHEFNASTFVARVCASTLSDVASCIVGGIGTLKGPLHGGANEKAMDMLLQFKTAEEARQWTVEEIASNLNFGFAYGAGALVGFVVLMLGCLCYWRRRPEVVLLLCVPAGIGATLMLAMGHPLWPRFFFLSNLLPLFWKRLPPWRLFC